MLMCDGRVHRALTATPEAASLLSLDIFFFFKQFPTFQEAHTAFWDSLNTVRSNIEKGKLCLKALSGSMFLKL